MQRKRLIVNSQNSLVLLNYREDGITPYVLVLKAGLKEEKV